MPRAIFCFLLTGAAALGLACDADPEGEGESAGEPAIGDPDYDRDPSLDVELVSEHGGQSSHSAGENCVQCHQALGPGPGRFTVAGTVYEADGSPSPDATVELWTKGAGMGELIVAVEADANGNFFTTEPIDFFAGAAYPFVRAADGVRTTQMPFPTKSGACNICHAGGFVVRL